MKNRRDVKRSITRIMAPLLALVLITYFLYHSIQGDRGILAWFQISQTLETAKSKHAALKEQRESLEEKVNGLRPESLNKDLLEQQAKKYLGYKHPDELIVMDDVELIEHED